VRIHAPIRRPQISLVELDRGESLEWPLDRIRFDSRHSRPKALGHPRRRLQLA